MDMDTYSISSTAHYQFTVIAAEAMDPRQAKRTNLIKWRLLVSKMLTFLALASLIITVLNTQLIIYQKYLICSPVALGLKSFVTVLNVSLLVTVWVYGYIQIKIFMSIRNIESMTMAVQLNRPRVIVIVLESVITVLSPLPFCYGGSTFLSLEKSSAMAEHSDIDLHFNTTAPTLMTDFNATRDQQGFVELSRLESLMCILTFLRLYHVGRFAVLHSRLFRTMLSYSIGALAHTKYNLPFIFKSYMAVYKGYFLVTLAFMYAFIAAWCIYISDPHINKYWDALWVVAITFFTVGYGDISPRGKSAQVISVMTGFVGMFCMGVSVSILSRYLQLTYDEYCMLSFIIDSDLESQRKSASASIIKTAWKVHRVKHSSDMLERVRTQKQLVKAIHLKRSIDVLKVTSRERREKQVPLYDMKESMKKLLRRTEGISARQEQFESEMKTLHEQLMIAEQKLTLINSLAVS